MRPLDPRLLRATPTVRGRLALLGALGVAQAAATVGTAVALAALVVGLVSGDGAPTTPLAWTAGLLTLRGALAAAVERVAARAGSQVAADLRHQLLGRWLERDAGTRPDPAAAATLAGPGVASVEPYVSRYLPALVTAAVGPVLALLTLLVVDPLSALVVALTLPLLPLFAALVGATTQEDTERRRRSLTDLSGHFLDVMRGLPTLAAYGRGDRQVRTITVVSRRHREATMRTLRLAFVSSAALELLASLSVALVAVVVGIRLTGGGMALGTGLVAILLAPEAYWPIRRVGAEFHAAADGAAALDEILAEIDGPGADEEPTAAPSDQTGRAVRAHDLRYRYPGADHEVLTGLDLDARPGLTVITGSSGAGKSTALELLAGLRRPDAGRVESGRTHLVTQRHFLVPGTIRDNLRLGGPERADRGLLDALDEVGLGEAVAALPDGLGTWLGDEGLGLSAGQRARLVIARALLAEADVVLLDEPTAHLDPESAATIHEVVRRLAADRVVVAVTHRPELVALADQHVRLGGGRAAAPDLAAGDRATDDRRVAAPDGVAA